LNKTAGDEPLEVLFTADEIAERVETLAREIERDAEDGAELCVVGVLRGAFVFVSDLVRALDLPVTVQFLRASSYGDSTTSSGDVNIQYDLEDSIENKHVLLVDDIADTGLTLETIYNHLDAKLPVSLRTCCMLRKPERMETDLLDYVGYDVPNRFVVGYGLDYAEKYRHLPFLAALPEREND
jgi:hypoxanthine phosphoribosyltransferase